MLEQIVIQLNTSTKLKFLLSAHFFFVLISSFCPALEMDMHAIVILSI